MDHNQAKRWLEGYAAAWRSNDREAIASLFTTDVEYRYHPYDDPVAGIDHVIESWLESPDEPDSWEAAYGPYAVDGNRVVATGTSRYLVQGDQVERLYHNCFLLEFDDSGRCSRFTEYFMKEA